MNYNELVKIAHEVKEKAYARYSGFRVGAALLTYKDEIYTGVNIENASYGATCCAERTAVFKAVSEGKRKFKAIAIASDSDKIVFPCGICRQVLAEFGESDMEIICSRNDGEYEVYTLDEILPHAFKSIKNKDTTGGIE